MYTIQENSVGHVQTENHSNDKRIFCVITLHKIFYVNLFDCVICNNDVKHNKSAYF